LAESKTWQSKAVFLKLLCHTLLKAKKSAQQNSQKFLFFN